MRGVTSLGLIATLLCFTPQGTFSISKAAFTPSSGGHLLSTAGPRQLSNRLPKLKNPTKKLLSPRCSADENTEGAPRASNEESGIDWDAAWTAYSYQSLCIVKNISSHRLGGSSNIPFLRVVRLEGSHPCGRSLTVPQDSLPDIDASSAGDARKRVREIIEEDRRRGGYIPGPVISSPVVPEEKSRRPPAIPNTKALVALSLLELLKDDQIASILQGSSELAMARQVACARRRPLLSPTRSSQSPSIDTISAEPEPAPSETSLAEPLHFSTAHRKLESLRSSSREVLCGLSGALLMLAAIVGGGRLAPRQASISTAHITPLFSNFEPVPVTASRLFSGGVEAAGSVGEDAAIVIERTSWTRTGEDENDLA